MSKYIYNTIYVSPIKGLKVVNLKKCNTSDYTWKESYIQIRDLGKSKTYDIYISKDHEDYDIIIRPREKYMCANFESLFFFSQQCKDYDKNRIIGRDEKLLSSISKPSITKSIKVDTSD